MEKDDLNGFLKKGNEALFSISTVIITLIANIILIKSHNAFIKLFFLYIPSFLILISFYYVIKHKVYKQEVSHDPDVYTYIEDSHIPKIDRVIIFISSTFCAWMVLTTGIFFQLFVR